MMKKEKFKIQHLQPINQKGITLIALVVTIVVLLILATVSIIALVGENGLITRARLAAEKTNEAVNNDMEAIQKFSNELDEYIAQIKAKKISKAKPTLQSTTNIIIATQNQTSENLDIEYAIKKVSDTNWETWSSSGNFTEKIFNTDYQVKTRVKNEAGEYIESEIEQITTKNITKPTINITTTAGTPKTATATINYTQTSGLTKQYSFDGTDWKTYTQPLQITQDATIYARNIDSTNQGTDSSLIDTAIIDITAPSVGSYSILNQPNDSLELTLQLSNVSETDGTITLKYYIKLSSANDSDYELKYEGTKLTCLFTNLSLWTSYTIKVEIIDAYGNVGTNTMTAGTQCFVAGTQVLTKDGMKNIEDIEFGDMVYSINLDTNARELKPVINLFRGKSDEIYEITIGNEVVSATPKHQFYIVDKGWIRAYDLEEGDKIDAKDNQELVITHIEHKFLKEPVDVYNLTVEGHHNYLITKYELLVHNLPSVLLK